MKTFNITIQGRTAGDFLNKEIKAGSIQEALTEICRECIEEDNTGYFFELENADVQYLNTQKNFYKIEVDGYEYGTIVESYTEK